MSRRAHTLDRGDAADEGAYFDGPRPGRIVGVGDRFGREFPALVPAPAHFGAALPGPAPPVRRSRGGEGGAQAYGGLGLPRAAGDPQHRQLPAQSDAAEGEAQRQKRADVAAVGDWLDRAGIIQPPDLAEVDYPRKYVRLLVDSRDRNADRYPDPQAYALPLELGETLQDVISAELVSACAPFSRYLINALNDTLYVSENGDGSGAFAVKITHGNYQADMLAAQLQTVLRAACTATITVTFAGLQADVDTETFTFRSNLGGGVGGFWLNFKGATVPYGPQSTARVTVPLPGGAALALNADGSLAHQTLQTGDSTTAFAPAAPGVVLGFRPRDYAGVAAGTVTVVGTTLLGAGTAFTTDLTGLPATVVLWNAASGSETAQVTAVASDTQASLATPPFGAYGAGSTLFNGVITSPVQADLSGSRYLVLKLEGVHAVHSNNPAFSAAFAVVPTSVSALQVTAREQRVIKFFTPLRRFDELCVRWLDDAGNAYDFGGVDHWFEVVFVCGRQGARYTEVFRGHGHAAPLPS
jgi:hypothetical protein